MIKGGNNNIKQQAFWSLLGQVVPNVLSFATMAIFTRILGKTGYGLWSIYLAWVTIFQLLTGLNIDGTTALAQVSYNNEEQKLYYSAVIGISCIALTAICLMMTIFMKKVSVFLEMPVWMVWLLIFTGFGTFAISLTVNRSIYNKNAKRSFFIRLMITGSTVILSLCFVLWSKFDSVKYKGRIIGYSIPYVLSAVIIIIMTFVQGGKPKIKKYKNFCLSLCFPLMINSLAYIVLSQSDRVMLQKLLKDYDSVGIYSAAYTLSSVLLVLLGALDNTWVAYYYEDCIKGRLESIKDKSKTYQFLFTRLTVGFILLSPEVYNWFTGYKFESGLVLLPLFAINVFLTFCSSFPVNFEIINQCTKLVAIGSIGAAILNILLNTILIPYWGIYGAGIATSISYIFLMIFHWTIATNMKDVVYHFCWRDFSVNILEVICATVIFYITINAWYIRWLLGAIVGLNLIINVIYKNLQ